MKNGRHILNSEFTKDYAFGFFSAKPDYAVRKPIGVFKITYLAWLGCSFFDFVYFSFSGKMINTPKESLISRK